MLAAATSLFKGTAIAQNYTLSTSTPSSSSTNVSALPPPTTFNVGPWKVQAATHKVTAKQVSVWTFEKKSIDKVGHGGRERILEVLKAETSSLGRLRHPCILEMVEHMEETRSELTFATELLTSSLALAIPHSRRSAGGGTDSGELDEVEIQKGILQVCRGLEFLHTSAKLVHSNLNPESILINSKGDWKLSGLGLTTPLLQADGTKTRWEFPEYDARLPHYVQKKFDYMAPEYALDEQIEVSSDMYALGCVIHAAHNYGRPPFANRGSIQTLRENAARLARGEQVASSSMGGDLRDLINHLVTRSPVSRLTTTTLPTQPFFSSLAISTLNFLERSTFSAKSKEEKATFMKGLLKVLPRFSEGLKRRKILPSLVEEMKDTWLLPFILPNVFEISKTLSKDQFADVVLPSIKPLFQVRDPPQNMITLLDNLKLFQEKTTPAVFKEQVMPLIYNALESEHMNVQERALTAVPDVSETVDYNEVLSVLFPRVAVLFTKTRVLSVKVNSLVCFLHLVKILDTASLTQKMVPLLSRIRTKEPSVMMATLDVHEAMGQKVDREAVATLVLPQLWAMSMGPLLSLQQFSRFMKIIRALGDRVEREHSQHLRETQRIEQQTSSYGASRTGHAVNGSGELEFEDLVVGGKHPALGDSAPSANGPTWDEADPWGSIFADAGVNEATSPAFTSAITSPMSGTSSLPSPLAAPMQTTSFPLSPPLQPASSMLSPPLPRTTSYRSPTTFSPATSARSTIPTSIPPLPGPSRQVSNASIQRTASPLSSSWTPLQAQASSASAFAPSQPFKPNYNISMDTTPPMSLTSSLSSPSLPQLLPAWSSPATFHSAPAAPPVFNPPAAQPFFTPAPMGQGLDVLTPTKLHAPGTGAKKPTDWKDFDPLG